MGSLVISAVVYLGCRTDRESGIARATTTSTLLAAVRQSKQLLRAARVNAFENLRFSPIHAALPCSFHQCHGAREVRITRRPLVETTAACAKLLSGAVGHGGHACWRRFTAIGFGTHRALIVDRIPRACSPL